MVVCRMYVFAKDLEKSFEEVEEKDIRAAQDYLKDVFKRVASIVGENVSEGQQERVLADLLVAVFKAPFYSDPIDVVPGEGAAAFISPYNYFLSLYIASYFKTLKPVRNIVETTFSENLFTFADPGFLDKVYDGVKDIATEIFELMKKSIKEESGYRSLFKIPQDTRPGLNFGLIPHMLLTSAILWSVLYERSRDIGVFFDKEGLSGEDRSSLRLVALAHDLGKVFDYRRHVEKGAEFFERLARETGYSVFAKISEFIRLHHVRVGPISRLISEADRAASALDRNIEIAKKLLRSELERLGVNADKLYSFGRDAWEEFDKIEDRLGYLTKVYVEKRSQESLEAFFGEEEELREDEWDVFYLVIDVGGIQSLIQRGSFLQTMVGASFLVDLIVTTIIPYIIVVRLGIPPENIVASSGGNVGIIIPKSLLEKALGEIKKLETILQREGIDLRLYTIYTPLIKLRKDEAGSYYLVWRPIKRVIDDISKEKKLLAKYVTDAEGRWILEGLAVDNGKVDTIVMCESCGLRPATESLEKAGETYDLCKTCKSLYEIGYKLVFSGKFSSRIMLPIKSTSMQLAGFIHPKLLEMKPPEEAWKVAGEKVLEFIAGHSFNFVNGQLVVKEDRKMNIAVIAADGDDMGSFFSNSMSFAEFYEKSLYTDLALKRAIREFSEELIKEMGEDLGGRELARLLFGFLYVGGDDLLGIVPAYLAIPYAVKLSLTFKEVMRGRTLSIGIASAKYDHPIWLLINAARRLEKEAKKGCKGNGLCGREFLSISFVYVDQGLLSGLTAETIIEKYREMGFTIQPLRISEGDDDELLKILMLLGIIDRRENPSAALLRRLKVELTKDPGKKLEWIDAKKTVNYYRKAWNYTFEVMGELIESLKPGDDSIEVSNFIGKLVRITVARNLQRVSEARRYYMNINEILSVSGEVSNPFADVYMLFKLMRGGLR